MTAIATISTTSDGNNRISLFINGVLVNSATFTYTFTNSYTLSSCYVGKSLWAADPNAAMDLREFLVFDGCLTGTQVSQMHTYLYAKYNPVNPVQPCLRLNSDVTIARGGRLGIGTDEPQGDIHIHGTPMVNTSFTKSMFAPLARVYHPDNQNNAIFGGGVAVSGNGKIMAVAAYYYNITMGGNEGGIYVYYNDKGRWKYTQRLTASDAAANDYLGYGLNAVALTYDGTVLVVGAGYKMDYYTSRTLAGKVYIFRSSGRWHLWSSHRIGGTHHPSR